MDQVNLKFVSLVSFLFYLLLHLAAALADLNSDKQALLDFMTFVRYGRKLNWNSSAVCSSWIGVTCSADGKHVISLRLPGFGLSGPIPANALGKLDALEILSLRSNLFVGTIPSKITSLPALRFLYLQNNSLTGSIPTFLSSNLSALDLSFNSLDGQISTSLENLSQLMFLNLQNNSLTGPIPDFNLPKLKILNFSFNNFSGSIPFSLQKFPNSSFLGNPHLCGTPLVRCLPIIPSSPSSSVQLPQSPTTSATRRKPSTMVIIAIGTGGLALLALMALVFFCCIYKKKALNGSALKSKTLAVGRSDKNVEQFSSGAQEAEKNKLSFFEGCAYHFDLEDLLRASAEVLGKGSYGTAYKAVLEDGTILVVKRLKDVLVGKKEFEQQMEIIGSLTQHANVLPLRAYYYSKDEKLMVYEFIPHGNLCSALHGDSENAQGYLDWETRLKVALGGARGIVHIHSGAGGKLIHGNIKSANVLLSHDTSVRITDFGLAPIMGAPVVPRMMAGYRAPELINHHKPTQKSDVYSFGVLLLEMLTGKTPLKFCSNDDLMDLPRWVQSVVHEEWTSEVFDVELMRQPNVEEEMVQMLQIAMACVAKLPDQRPNMMDVVRMIKEIRQECNRGNIASSEPENRFKDLNIMPSEDEED